MSQERDERLVVALVRGVHGLRGALRLEVLTDDDRRFSRGSPLYPEGSAEPLTVSWSRVDGPGRLIRFRERTTREDAEGLRGRYLEAPARSEALPSGSWYWHEVLGSRVMTLEGEDLGAVEDVFRAGGGEVYVVRGGDRGEVLVPAVSAVIRELAPVDGRIVVDADALGLEAARPIRRPRGRRSSRAWRDGARAEPPGLAPPAPEPPSEDRGSDAPEPTTGGVT